MPPQPPLFYFHHLIPPLILLITTISSTPCPPFTTTPPPYPFSNHPSFHVKCSPPPSLATITINHHNFTILHYDYDTTMLTLIPHPTSTTTNTTCTTLTTIPTQPINFTNTPFKPSDSFCSRLTYLHPCHQANHTKCDQCPFLCKVAKMPSELIPSCGSIMHPSQLNKEGCQDDILGFLDTFLKFGIEVEFQEKEDAYFLKCKECRSVNGVCGFNSSDPKKSFLCSQDLSFGGKKYVKTRPRLRVVMMFVCVLFLCVLLFFLVKKYVSRKIKTPAEDAAVVYLHRHRSASLLPPVFTFDELQLATDNFDPSRKIGDGGFGSVYIGHFQENKVFAIKYLHKQNPTSNSFSTKSFCNEILILSSLNHPNLIKLHGYCSDPRGLLLVYEYVPNGTLSDHLHLHAQKKNKCILTWQLRVDIALQIATAIEYLHFNVVPPIVHRDITSNNIFIDKDMIVRVGDFGLSRLLDPGCVWTGPQGTPGYLDPDYYKSFRLTEKSDIYSFGVVLLELVTGMRAVDGRRDKREIALVDMAVGRIQMGLLEEVIDPRLAAVDSSSVAAMAELSFRCVAADKDDRPDAREVVAELRRIKGRVRGAVGTVRVLASSNVVVPDGVL